MRRRSGRLSVEHPGSRADQRGLELRPGPVRAAIWLWTVRWARAPQFFMSCCLSATRLLRPPTSTVLVAGRDFGGLPLLGKMKILAGNSNGPLAESIAAYLGEPLTGCHVRRFADLEIFVEILENVRGRDAFIIQSTSYPAHDNLMELLIMIDALRRASAQRITAVMPYFGSARQDRKPAPRSPISAQLVANVITRAAADRVLTAPLHAAQIHGFFDIPTVNLFSAQTMVRDILAQAAVSHTTVA